VERSLGAKVVDHSGRIGKLDRVGPGDHVCWAFDHRRCQRLRSHRVVEPGSAQRRCLRIPRGGRQRDQSPPHRQRRDDRFRGDIRADEQCLPAVPRQPSTSRFREARAVLRFFCRLVTARAVAGGLDWERADDLTLAVNFSFRRDGAGKPAVETPCRCKAVARFHRTDGMSVSEYLSQYRHRLLSARSAITDPL
jgi:hypothetical protein